MAKAAHNTVLPGRVRGRLLALLFILLLLYLILPRLDAFSASIAVIGDAQLNLLFAAGLMVGVTYGFAAGTYQLLALRLRGVQYRHTLLVQLATAFTNRLLPAGLGGLTVNVQYLRNHGHLVSEAVAIAGLNNVLGAAGHLLLLGIVVVLQPQVVLQGLELPHISQEGVLAIGLAAVGVLNVLFFRRLRKVLRKGFSEAARYLATYRRHPEKVAAALLCSMALTACYAVAFYLCLESVGIALPVWSAFAVFTVGVAAAAITPTPGGLVGAEAGLVAGLMAYGWDAGLALAGVLLFRGLTYWVPLIGGFAVFMAIRKRYLFS